MDKLPVTITLAILNKMSVPDMHRIATILIKYVQPPKARGWHRAINTDKLFHKAFMRIPNRNVEIPLWITVFHEYPKLSGSYAENFRRYITRIEPELAIQDWLDNIAHRDPSGVTRRAIEEMREFRTPIIGYSTMRDFVSQMITPTITIHNLIQLHNWPDALHKNGGLDPVNFWDIVCESLVAHIHVSRDVYQEKSLIRPFIIKYREHINWKKVDYRDLYGCLREQFFDDYPEMCAKLNWVLVLTYIPLSEERLAVMMELANAKQQYHGQNVNVAYIFSHQYVSEAFIEKHVVNKLYDQEYIWANIFRKQRLTSAFCEKYADCRAKPQSYALRELMGKMM
jgi:hypothetical protein